MWAQRFLLHFTGNFYYLGHPNRAMLFFFSFSVIAPMKKSLVYITYDFSSNTRITRNTKKFLTPWPTFENEMREEIVILELTFYFLRTAFSFTFSSNKI